MARNTIHIDVVARDKASATLQKVGKILSVATVAAMAASAKAAIDYESAFAGVRKTVDASEEEFAAMSAGIRDMAKAIPTSANELAGLAEIAGQLGVENDSILEFTETIAMLGDTTDIAGETAALSLSRLMNVMGTSQGEISNLGSTIVDLGNNMAARESEIVDISTSLASFGQQVGFSESQVLAFGATIAASGGEAQAAATAFQKIGLTMKEAVLTGNEDLAKFAETAGMTGDEFKQAFEKDSAQALSAFLRGLKDVNDAGESSSAILDELGLADQRLIREIGKVTANLDDLDSAFGIADKAYDENTALTEEAEKRYETLASQLGILKNNVVDLAIQIGSALMPVIENVSNGIQWFVQQLQEGNPLVITITSVLGTLAGIVMAYATATWIASAATSAWAAATIALTSPLFLTIAAIGALIAIGIALWKNWDTVREKAIELWDVVVQFTADAREKLGEIIDKAKEIVNQAITPIKDGFNELKKTAKKVLDDITSWFEENKTAIENVAIVIGTILLPKFAQIAGQAAVAAAKTVASFVSMAAGATANAATTAAAWVASSATTAFAWVTKTLPKLIASFATMSAQATANAVKASAAWVASSVKTLIGWGAAFAGYLAGVATMVFQTAMAAAKMVVSWMLALGPIGLIVAAVIGLTALIVKNWDTVRRVSLALWEKIKSGFNIAWEFIKKTWSKVVSVLTAPIRLAVSVITSSWNRIKNSAASAVDWIRSKWDRFLGFFSNIGSKISGFGSSIKNAVMSPFKTAFNAIAGFWNSTVAKVSFKAPDWVPKFGGKGWSIPEIPRLATGTDFFGGGMAMVGERGRELVNLPRGAQVLSNDKTERMMGATINIYGNVVNETPEAADRFFDRLDRMSDLAQKGNPV